MRLFVEPATDRVDQYGRPLRYVVRVNGALNVNIRLMAVGAAAPYFYRGRRGRYAGLLRSPCEASESEEARPMEGMSSHALQPLRRGQDSAVGLVRRAIKRGQQVHAGRSCLRV